MSPPFSSGPGAPGNVMPGADPRLQATPDYGTLGPGSDIAGVGSGTSQAPQRKNTLAFAHLLAVAIGIACALIAGSASKTRTSWSGFADLLSKVQSSPASARDIHQLDRMKPQKQAETLLELAVGHSDEAVDQISSRVDRWQGQVQWNSQIATLTTAALNSTDMRVRESGVEVELAAYGLAKNPASLDYLLRTAESPDHAQKIWALWALGLMANRGVGTSQVVGVLAAHLKDSDADARRWAVEGLALTGSDQAIAALLATMHDDSSPLVRERAACSLASSGMFTPEQRLSAVPQLLNYADDRALDAQTRGWAFLALSDITHQRLPNNSTAWRKWYESTRAQ